jgi:hypothetical protein
MPLAPDTAFFDLQVAGKRTRQLLQTKYLMDKSYWASAAVQSTQPTLTRDSRLQLCVDVVTAISLITRLGLAYGDVSGNNLCAALEPLPTVFFLDADSIEFVDNPMPSGMTTVDWISPVADDRVSRTRSLGALLVWRLLCENPTSYPDASVSAQSLPVNGSLTKAISDCYRSGAELDFELVGRLLREALTPAARRDLLQRAIKSQFARSVIEVVDVPRDSWEVAVLDAASRHVDAERRIEASSPTRQRLMIQKYLGTPGAYVLDLSPNVHRVAPPRSEDELHALALEARFFEIARFFVSGDLLDLDKTGTAIRSIGHALADTSTINITATTQPGTATLRWKWPQSDFVNCAEIAAHGIAGHVSSQRLKRSGQAEMQYSVNLPAGGTVTSFVKFGCMSPTGSFVASSVGADLVIDIPPEVRKVAGNSNRAGLSSHVVLQVDPKDLFDDSAAYLALRRRKKRRLILAGGLVALALASLLAVRILRDSDGPAPSDACLTLRRIAPTSNLISC